MKKEQETAGSRLSPGIVAGIILALIFSFSLFLRIFFPYDQVFGGELIKFTGVDAYYQMRLVDNIVHNFPGFSNFAPYFNYPSGSPIDTFPFFNWLLAGIIWVIGLGSPTAHTIDIVGVYFPAVLGALTVFPVYIIGKKVFGRWAGIFAAGLIAIMPGEFLGRSILGFTDHHIAEVLLTTTAVMFLVMAIKVSLERGLTFQHLRQRDRTVITRPILYSLLSGVFLGMYLLAWIGGLFFVFILAAFFVVQFFVDHLKRRSTDYLAITGVTVFLTAMIIYSVAWHKADYLIFNLMPIAAALFACILLNVTSRWMVSRGIKPAYYPLSLIGAGLAAVLILYFTSGLAHSLLGQFRIFAWDASRTIIEMQPFLRPNGDWTLAIALGNFTSGFFICLLMLLFLFGYTVRQGEADKTLLLVWSLAILLATLGQRRFAYYLAINVSLLTGYALWTQCQPAHRWFKIALPAVMIVFIFLYQSFATWFVSTGVLLLAGYIVWQIWPGIIQSRHIQAAKYLNRVMIIFLFFLVFYPSLQMAVPTASSARFAPTDAWVSSLSWMRANTPEPFDDPEFYYQRYEAPPPETDFPYPDSAYGVIAWTDYGYWITRIARRPPSTIPGPGGSDVARFFLAQDEETAAGIAQEMDSRYVVIDDLTASSKFWALAQWAGGNITQFHDVYLVPQSDGNYRPARLFHEEYYQAMLIRLYHFNGEAVTPRRTLVIAYEERPTDTGELVKLIIDVQIFTNYPEATAYMSAQESGNYRIVSDNPFASPVPLAEVENFRLVHSSDDQVPNAGTELPSVKIFEYVP
ncbi:MAG: oligosaccharyl transferase, archaeosortase A system-associated [Dehalococcoidales bacterium]